MDVVLKALNPQCAVSGRAFVEGDRIVSLLVRGGAEFARTDVLEEKVSMLQPAGEVLCRWTHTFKPRPSASDIDREMRQSMESFFLGLYGDADKPAEGNDDVVRFLALFLERKRLIKPKVGAPAGWRAFEHVRQKRLFLVPEGELDAAFFMRIQAQMESLFAPNRPNKAALVTEKSDENHQPGT
jgi:hypothetical protein